MAKVEPVLTIRCAGRKPLKLSPGQNLRIGRHATNELCLNDGTVSRFHCTIMWSRDDDRPSVVDHDSANGVELDGEFVEGKGWITGGNQLVVGNFTLALELSGTRETQQVSANNTMSDFLVADDSDSVVLYTEKKKDQAGRFSTAAELHDFCTETEGAGRTGTLTLRVAAVQAKVTFCVGKVMAATYGDAEGKDALKQIFGTRTCLYQFKREIHPTEQQLDVSVKDFLKNEMTEPTKRIVGRNKDGADAPSIEAATEKPPI